MIAEQTKDERHIKTGMSPSFKAVTQALRLTQGDLKNIAANRFNADFQWTSIDAVTAAILPIASQHKLVYSHNISYVGEPYPQVVCDMKLLHEDGEWISYSKAMPVDVDGRSIVQCVGAAQTYARRTQLLEVFGISSANMPDVDDQVPQAAIVAPIEPKVTKELIGTLIEHCGGVIAGLDGTEMTSVFQKFNVKSWAGLRLVDYPAALKAVDQLVAEKQIASDAEAHADRGLSMVLEYTTPEARSKKKAKKKASKKDKK